jgi:hypothetical protein
MKEARMYPKATHRAVTAAWVLGLATLMGAPSALAAPVRLKLTIDKATLGAGEHARLRVAFLDRDYQPVANDRERTVYLETRSAGPAETGSGDIAPRQATAPAGGTAASEFRAVRRGRLLIRATSDGLAPAQELVTVVAGPAGLLEMLMPAVHAWADDAFAIYPKDHLPVPVNGSSTALFTVTVGRRVEKDEIVRVRVATRPAVPVSYDGRESPGFAEFEIPEGNSNSRQIEISSEKPRLVSVSARIVEARPAAPRGARDEDVAVVQFIPPRPERVVVKPEQTGSSPLWLPLTVSLEDSEHTAITALDRAHTIQMSSRSGVSFDRKRLQLSPTKPTGHATARLGLFSWGELQIVAADVENDLGTGSATVSVRVAATMLLLCAGLSGAFGALSRHAYRVRTSRLLPAWHNGRMKLGLLGNTVFGIGFGEVLYQAGRLGLLHPPLVPSGSAPEDGTLLALALLLGVLGGFGGVVILDRLTERILPAPKAA